MEKEAIIQKFHMKPHAEGGYYAEIRKLNNGTVSQIYYLLDAYETASWHRLQSEEIWLYHDGGNLSITLGNNGKAPQEETSVVLGKENPSFHIPSDYWQKATAGEKPVLVSCLVCPAFDWNQWELHQKENTK